MNDQIDWPVYLAECRQDARGGDLAYRDVDRLIDKIERLQAALALATENEHLFLKSLGLRDADVVRLETALVAVTAERDRYRAALTALTDPAHEPTLTRDEGIEICAYCQQFAFHHAEDCPIVMGRAALAPDAPREGETR